MPQYKRNQLLTQITYFGNKVILLAGNKLKDCTLLDVIKMKVDELKLDTDYSNLITSHSLEKKFEK